MGDVTINKILRRVYALERCREYEEAEYADENYVSDAYEDYKTCNEF